MCHKLLATLDVALFDSYNCSDLAKFASYVHDDRNQPRLM